MFCFFCKSFYAKWLFLPFHAFFGRFVWGLFRHRRLRERNVFEALRLHIQLWWLIFARWSVFLISPRRSESTGSEVVTGTTLASKRFYWSLVSTNFRRALFVALHRKELLVSLVRTRDLFHNTCFAVALLDSKALLHHAVHFTVSVASVLFTLEFVAFSLAYLPHLFPPRRSRGVVVRATIACALLLFRCKERDRKSRRSLL